MAIKYANFFKIYPNLDFWFENLATQAQGHQSQELNRIVSAASNENSDENDFKNFFESFRSIFITFLNIRQNTPSSVKRRR
jgi:hemoglobin-like flavoprotein